MNDLWIMNFEYLQNKLIKNMEYWIGVDECFYQTFAMHPLLGLSNGENNAMNGLKWAHQPPK